MNPRLTALVEVVEAHAMNSLHEVSSVQLKVKLVVEVGGSLSLESSMKKGCMFGWSQSQQQLKVKVTRDPLLNGKKPWWPLLPPTEFPYMIYRPRTCFNWQLTLLGTNVMQCFLSFGARCSSERTEKRKVKKILDRGGNIKITKSYIPVD